MRQNTKIVLLGLGKVGQAFLKQVQEYSNDFSFSALADSTAFIMGNPLNEEQINDAVEHKRGGSGLADLDNAQPLHDIARVFSGGAIVVDTSAARSLNLLPALTAGCKLVFANKNALSAPWAEAKPYFSPSVVYEATVGAGLPVIAAIQTLRATGDKITRIEGVMSGTLGFLCSQLEAGVLYSQAIQTAFSAGYTEPDPRDDLSGFDVARKALILGRTAGWPLEKSQQTVEQLYDEGLARLSTLDFFKYMSLMDNVFADWVKRAHEQGKVLRYVASIDCNGSQVGLQRVDVHSALGSLHGPGNYFAIYSQRYAEIPLVITGPGAGVEVTAAGVFADVLRLAAS